MSELQGVDLLTATPEEIADAYDWHIWGKSVEEWLTPVHAGNIPFVGVDQARQTLVFALDRKTHGFWGSCFGGADIWKVQGGKSAELVSWAPAGVYEDEGNHPDSGYAVAHRLFPDLIDVILD